MALDILQTSAQVLHVVDSNYKIFNKCHLLLSHSRYLIIRVTQKTYWGTRIIECIRIIIIASIEIRYK